MEQPKYLIFGVYVAEREAPLWMKSIGGDVEYLERTLGQWEAVIAHRVSMKKGFMKLAPSISVGNYIEYGYEGEDIVYYVDILTCVPDSLIIPSPTLAFIYEQLDKPPVAVFSQGQAFNMLWEAVKERERVGKEAVARSWLDHMQQEGMGIRK